MLARSTEPLGHLDAISSCDDDLVGWTDFDDHWKLVMTSGPAIAENAPALVAELFQATGEPALTGFVLDSDCIDVYGFGGRSGLWRACLNRESMAGYLADESAGPLDATFPSAVEAARRAAAWALEAGLRPDEAGLVELFGRDDRDLFVEGQFDELLVRLGVPRSEIPRVTQPVMLGGRRFAAFLDTIVAPHLEAAGFVRDGRLFRASTDRGDQIGIGLDPFGSEFVIRCAVRHCGLRFPQERSFPDMDVGLFESSLVGWRRAWPGPAGEPFWPLPAERDSLSEDAGRVIEALDDIMATVLGIVDPEAFADVLHHHTSFDTGAGTYVPDSTRVELRVLQHSGPTFALADAIRRTAARESVDGPHWAMLTPDAVTRWASPEFQAECGRTAALVRHLWGRLLDGWVTPALTARGLVVDQYGYQMASPDGSRVLIDLELSATSRPDGIAFFVHAGLLVVAQADWDADNAERFDRPLPPRRAMFGWFAQAPRPPATLAGDHPALALLKVHPWRCTERSLTECGRVLVRMLAAECDRLIPLLDPVRRLAAISTTDTRFAAIIMTLLPDGPSAELEANLRIAEVHPDPAYHDLAQWARERLTT